MSHEGSGLRGEGLRDCSGVFWFNFEEFDGVGDYSGFRVSGLDGLSNGLRDVQGEAQKDSLACPSPGIVDPVLGLRGETEFMLPSSWKFSWDL